MENKEGQNQDNHPSHLHNHTTTRITIAKEESPQKPIGGGGACGGSAAATAGSGDRLKRDEWSEGAVSTLLEAYEAKWVLRNRAKLKGHDWEDVARHVSSRANGTKPPKTQTQCKNKIESMKKRYRSESATADNASSWPLYSRLDLLLRGTGPPASTQPAAAALRYASPSQPPYLANDQSLMLLEPSPAVLQQPPHQPPPLAAPPPLANAQNSNGSNGDDRLAKEDGLGTKSSEHISNKNPLDSDSSTPALYSDSRCKKRKTKIENNRRRKEGMEIAESIRWLAKLVVRSEQARMETMKEIERMRAEAEAKRGEMDVKRTEIIAKTQIEIARIFARVNKGTIDSSLRIGRS